MSISIATININGLRDDKKRRTFFDWLISKKNQCNMCSRDALYIF